MPKPSVPFLLTTEPSVLTMALPVRSASVSGGGGGTIVRDKEALRVMSAMKWPCWMWPFTGICGSSFQGKDILELFCRYLNSHVQLLQHLKKHTLGEGDIVKLYMVLVVRQYIWCDA
jgi:hypothetical protein